MNVIGICHHLDLMYGPCMPICCTHLLMYLFYLLLTSSKLDPPIMENVCLAGGIMLLIVQDSYPSLLSLEMVPKLDVVASRRVLGHIEVDLRAKDVKPPKDLTTGAHMNLVSKDGH